MPTNILLLNFVLQSSTTALIVSLTFAYLSTFFTDTEKPGFHNLPNIYLFNNCTYTVSEMLTDRQELRVIKFKTQMLPRGTKAPTVV